MLADFINVSKWSPPRILVSGFAVIILLGGLLLSLPFATTRDEPLRYLDAVFMATSATCVTGLVVADTGRDFTVLGQVMIMLLIQIGGLGFMTMATLFALVLKKRISLRERIVLQQAMNQLNMDGIVRLIYKVVVYAITIEATAAVLFTIRWAADMPLGKAAYFGMFHAVSFFNNAGFDLFGEYRSLTPYAEDPLVNIVSMALIILGGIGFVVIADVLDYRKNKKLALHTKVVLSMTVALIVIGAFVFFIIEYSNTLEPLSWRGKILASFFQSVTPRTAGANTVDIGALRQASQFFIIILMFIGAGPGSTAGGVKITTVAALAAGVKTVIRGKEDIVIYDYRLARYSLLKALTVTVLAMALVVCVTMVLSTTDEEKGFIRLLFETVSAFGTVGLSTGITPHLSDIARVLLCLTMFAGRLGPLTLAYALGPRTDKELYRFPEGKLIIG